MNRGKEYMNTLNQSRQQDYNSIPVHYCKHCLSLAIKGIESTEEFDYCETCGSVDIKQCSIEEWEELYKKAHNGRRYLDDKF